MAASSEWRTDLPAIWVLTEPAVVDDAMPDDADYEALTLRLVEVPGLPVQLLFGATSADRAAGELGAITGVLMEVASRLPEGNGLDAATWFMSNAWLAADSEQVTNVPCLVQEFEGGAMVVWRGGDGAALEAFFGTITYADNAAAEVERCRAAQEGAPAGPAASPATDPAAETVDYSVSPAEAVELIEAGEHTVIDVRTPAEYEQAHVVGAININVEAPDFAERIAELDPDAPYLLYCRTGRRSDLAAQQMAAAGFGDITDAAGLADLARAGAPIE